MLEWNFLVIELIAPIGTTIHQFLQVHIIVFVASVMLKYLPVVSRSSQILYTPVRFSRFLSNFCVIAIITVIVTLPWRLKLCDAIGFII